MTGVLLVELHIQNFALIDRLDIQFGPGLNVLTGETGAGKSIVVDALQLALGGRASADVVRTGADAARVEAVFHVSEEEPVVADLREMGVCDDLEPGLVILRRDIADSGRSRARINGHPVTVAQLLHIGEQLVDVHGQHDHQSLLRAANQLELLDAYGGPTLLKKRRQFAQLWQELVSTRDELHKLRRGERERARRLDLVRFQLDEIDGARLEVGEEERLQQLQAKLSQLGRLQSETNRLYTALSTGDDGLPSAGDVLSEAAQTAAELAKVDSELDEAAQLLETAALHVREAASLLRAYGERIEANPAELEQVADRLALIHDLRRKYGADVAEILTFADQLRQELQLLEGSDSREAELTAALAKLEKEASAAAEALSSARAKAATKLEKEVSAELEGLHMGPGRFSVGLHRQERPDGLPVGSRILQATATGVDRVEFLLSTNPGEPPRPLHRVASGGELSRVALALKRCLVAFDTVSTLVFDEIDAGIGGETAQAVAGRLVAISRQRQVICVTHLAQIATAAPHHLHVEKVVTGDRTGVRVTALQQEQRVREIARMLVGVLTESTLDNARELLALAQKVNPPN